MIKSFPLSSASIELSFEDFGRFSRSYGEILKKHIPTVNGVFFVSNIGQFRALYETLDQLDELESLFDGVVSGVQNTAIHQQCVMLPFPVKNEGRIVAILDQPDAHFRQKVSEDWLLETRSLILHEYQLLRQVRVDSSTGLLNVSNLFYLLDTYSVSTNLHLILIELPAKRPSFEYILRQSQKCSTLLQQFMQGDTALHHLGQSTFAFVLKNNLENSRREIEGSLVAYLKKAGCPRVHVGSSFSEGLLIEEDNPTKGRKLLDQAWTALHHASKKGPFSFCNYNLLAHPEKGPLSPPERSVARKLARLWAKSETFSLVHFKSDNNTNLTREFIEPSLLDQGVMVEYGNDILVYLDGKNKKVAFDWAIDTIRVIAEKKGNASSISVGVSCYPYGDFKKSEILFNCQKALLHAAFYGNSSGALFDAVSLNISGDIFFSDGNLAKAVTEYRRGLKCDSKDVNLHNSLGVALVMMNKLSLAMRSFEQALKLDRNNFMALYNLGLGEQVRNQKVKAYSYLKKALENYSDTEEGKDVCNDLKLQLGILSCDIGKYRETAPYLLAWVEGNKANRGVERIHFYLGKAHYELKENKKAMICLQRALRFNEFDDRAMNLLGRLYLEEKQGDDIALSLFRKSVELEPSNMQYWLDLARVQRQCGMLEEARDNLRRCLKRKEFKDEAQIEMARSYQDSGHPQKAKAWYRKVLTQQNGNKMYIKEADRVVNTVLQK